MKETREAPSGDEGVERVAKPWGCRCPDEAVRVKPLGTGTAEGDETRGEAPAGVTRGVEKWKDPEGVATLKEPAN